MSPRRCSSLATLLLATTILTALGGCPFDAAVLESGPETRPVTPGTYWVEDQLHELVYFEFPAKRGDVGRWIPVASDDAAWYEEPAWYDAAADGTWTRNKDLDALTLDEALAVYGATPPAP